MERELSEKIPFFSFLATCGIVLYHSGLPMELPGLNGLDLRLSGQLDALLSGSLIELCLCWFFGLTAFLLFRDLSFASLGKKLLRRVRTLLVPYLLWQLLYLVKELLQRRPWTLQTALGHIFLLQAWPPLQPFWYVYAVFLLSLLSPVFLLLFRREKSGWLAAAALLVALYALTWPLEVDGGVHYYVANIKMYFPAYVIGAYFGRFYREENRPALLLSAVGFLLLGAVFESCLARLMCKLALSVLPMLLLLLLPVPGWAKGRELYRASFLIFATHESLIALTLPPLRRLLGLVCPSAAAVNLLSRLLCLLAVLAANAAVRALMKRFTPKTLALLTGGRG